MVQKYKEKAGLAWIRILPLLLILYSPVKVYFMKACCRIVLFLLFLLMFSGKSNRAFAQEIDIRTPRTILLDSLKYLENQVINTRDSFTVLMSTQQARLTGLEQDLDQVKEENRNLKAELAESRGDNLQSDHTNYILFVFNILVGAILLIALIWMFFRRKPETVNANSNGQALPSNGSAAHHAPHADVFDHRLDRIEKLGSLREKGLLTDDEFNLQKRQILSERG